MPPAPKPPPPKKTPVMTKAEVRGFIEALANHNPAPETELSFSDPFTLLVAVVLSAQATDLSVNRATKTLFQVAPTPKAMIALGVDGVASHIRSIGLWQTKARNVVALARELEEKHGGQVPPEREALEALPGVGRKTANVVLNVAFGESTMAVDTHIFRLGNRTGLAPGKTPREVEDGLSAKRAGRSVGAASRLHGASTGTRRRRWPRLDWTRRAARDAAMRADPGAGSARDRDGSRWRS
jgi:endonuclease-3